MTHPRLLLPLLASAAGLLAAAVLLTAGDLPFEPAASVTRWVTTSVAAVRLEGALSPTLLLGGLIGWALRWLYELPWMAIPTAIVEWMRGWRQRASLLLVALGCIGVLLLY
ncbi:MAG: hypothetical protein SFW09_20755 [Hyphomicrobiaceae bacterium]|nr:hypothetical protein [Hyphomicrobiaceae bacterium]